ncbi:MAG: peptidylprolyl isomerase, partial [Pseudomonadota bacterium]
MKRLSVAVALCALFALPLPAQEADLSPETIVATVDGQDITLGEVLVLRSRIPAQYQSLPSEVLFEGIVQQLVQQRILAASLDESPEWLGAALDVERNSILANIVVQELSEAEITEDDIVAAYEARFATFEGAREFDASHILLATEEEARAAIERHEAGEDFAMLAQELSTGPSGPRGGGLGWFGETAMVPPFQAAVAALEVGAISVPVETQFGWHVIKLNATRVQEPPALEDVRRDIEG